MGDIYFDDVAGATWEEKLINAIDKIGSDPMILVLPPQADIEITQDISIPANIVLYVPPPKTPLVVNTGKTLAIASQPIAGPYQWLSLVGTGKVDFSNLVEVHVEWWGTAAGAFQKAHDSLPDDGGTINIRTNYSETAGIVISTRDVTVKKHGQVTLTFATGVAEAVTITGHRVVWPEIKILRASNTWMTGVDTASAGIVANNTRYSNIWVNVEGFAKGCMPYGESDGCVHNHFFIELIYDCRYGFYLDTDGALGWVTSNNFYGGNVAYRGATFDTAVANSIAMWNCYLNNNSYRPNSNVWYNTAFQSWALDSHAKLLYCDGQQNMWVGCRFEIGSRSGAYDGSYNVVEFVYAAGVANYNSIIGGRWVSQAIAFEDIVTYDDRSRNTFQVGDENINGPYVRGSYNSLKVAGSLSAGSGWTPYDANLDVQNTSTSAANLISLKNSAAAEKASITGYGQGRFGFEGGTPATTHGSLQVKGQAVSGYPDSQWRMTTNASTTNSTANKYILCDGYQPPANSIVAVKVWVIGRALDDSKAYFKSIAGLFRKDGTTLTLLDQDDDFAAQVHGADASTAVLEVYSSNYIAVKINADSADDRVWEVVWQWTILTSAS